MALTPPHSNRLLVLLTFAVGCVSTSAAHADRSSSSPPTAATSPAAQADRQVVTFPSGTLTLHGVVYKPRQAGAFPAMLWNHGSYADPMVAFDELGPTFVAHGWILFGPFRRGQGLSAAAGPYIDDEIARAGPPGGTARAEAMVRLLAGDHLDDQLAAYAWLKQQPFVAPGRIAGGGNSFGGIEVVLGSERVPYCAAVDGSGAAQSWAHAPPLRDLLVRAARASQAPTFFFQAENDFDLAPSRTLAAAMREAGKSAELEIYPPFGTNHGQGHNFAWHGSAVWAADVFAFLDRHCGAPPR
jgi:dipeptidyl aminopeptidase/acylaminoacyl peptidase